MNVWWYSISRGQFSAAFDSTPIYMAYSGKGTSRDRLEDVGLTGRGPIPPGLYRCLDPRDYPTLGHWAVPLKPHFTTQMYGRSGFYIHGDNGSADFSASRGCVILNLAARQHIRGGDIFVVLP